MQQYMANSEFGYCTKLGSRNLSTSSPAHRRQLVIVLGQVLAGANVSTNPSAIATEPLGSSKPPEGHHPAGCWTDNSGFRTVFANDGMTF